MRVRLWINERAEIVSMAESRPGRPRKWASNAERMRAYRAVERERREALRGQHDISEMAERVVTHGRARSAVATGRAPPTAHRTTRDRARRPSDGCHFFDARVGRDRRVVTCRASTARTRATAPPLTEPRAAAAVPQDSAGQFGPRRPTSTRVVIRDITASLSIPMTTDIAPTATATVHELPSF